MTPPRPAPTSSGWFVFVCLLLALATIGVWAFTECQPFVDEPAELLR